MSKMTNLRDTYYQAVACTQFGIPHNLGMFCSKEAAKKKCIKWLERSNIKTSGYYIIRIFDIRKNDGRWTKMGC